MANLKLQAPVQLTAKLYMTDGDLVAKLELEFPPGRFPSQDEIDTEIKKAGDGISDQVGDDWRVMTKREFWDEVMREKTGLSTKFALPGGEAWDV